MVLVPSKQDICTESQGSARTKYGMALRPYMLLPQDRLIVGYLEAIREKLTMNEQKSIVNCTGLEFTAIDPPSRLLLTLLCGHPKS